MKPVHLDGLLCLWILHLKVSSVTSKSTSSTSINRPRRHRQTDLDDIDFVEIVFSPFDLWCSFSAPCVRSGKVVGCL